VNILELIGRTPLVDVSHLAGKPGIRLHAKLENANPFGSIKDRAAKAMIEQARRDGQLRPGRRLLEASSGNTGIALAGIARLSGHPITVILPENVSRERKETLAALGARIVTSPGGEGSNGAIRRAEILAGEDPELLMLHQYRNDANPQTHYDTTGPEILRDLPQTTHFVAGLGTGGTLAGVGRYLKERNPSIKIVAVEPPVGETVEGLRNIDDGYTPPIITNWHLSETLDRRRIVRAEESIQMTRRLVRECGILAGLSSGANLAGALKIAEETDKAEIVFVVCDGAWKYLSTGAYTDESSQTAENVASTLYF